MAPSDWQESDFDNLTFLAKGSMCLVFKAREKRSRKTVALKVLFKKDILNKGLYEVLRREV
jgi:serine/threonine protein kinase